MKRKQKEDYWIAASRFIVNLILSIILLLLYSIIIYEVIHISGLDESIYLKGLTFLKVNAILVIVYLMNIFISTKVGNE